MFDMTPAEPNETIKAIFAAHMKAYKKYTENTQKQKGVKTAAGQKMLPENNMRVIQCVLDVDEELRIHGGKLPPHFGDLTGQIDKIRARGQKPFIVMTSDAMRNHVNPQSYAALSNGDNHVRYIVSEQELKKRGLDNPDLVYQGAKLRREDIRAPHRERIIKKRGFLPFGG